MTVACIGCGDCEYGCEENELRRLIECFIGDENARLFLLCGEGEFIDECARAIEKSDGGNSVSVKRADMPNLLARKYDDTKSIRMAEIRIAVSLADVVVIGGTDDETAKYASQYANKTRKRIVSVFDPINRRV